MEVTDHRHYDGQYIYKKIESLHLQECSLKKRSLWKRVLYKVSWRYKRDYLCASRDIFFYTKYFVLVQLCSILLIWWRTLDSFIPHLYLRYKKGPDMYLHLLSTDLLIIISIHWNETYIQVFTLISGLK